MIAHQRTATRRFPSSLCLVLAIAACVGHADTVPDTDKVLRESAHARLTCVECHEDATVAPHVARLANVACARCHEGQAAELAASAHGQPDAAHPEDLPSCVTCHGAHDVYKSTDTRSRTGHLRVDETCRGCHANPDVAARHPRLPRPEFVERYLGSVHGRGVRKLGLLVSATCSDCHGTHSIEASIERGSRTHRDNVPRTCARCHAGIFEDYKASAHGTLWQKGRQDGPVCTNCHEAHGIQEPETTVFRTGMPERCGGCHEAKASTFRDTFHGQSTSLGFVATAKCADCHTAHRNLPLEDPASSVNPRNLQRTCGQCHPRASANFVKYEPHLDLDRPTQASLVYFVSRFMRVLLQTVFWLWGLHTLLWLQRAIVAMLRREVRHASNGPYVRRFSATSIGTHVVIVASFLGLVATGIPLLYHGTAWAKVVGRLLGGVEVARYFHRLFAVATFGYAAFHLSFLGDQILRRGRLDLLYGPHSLAPRWKDVTDVAENVRWFLYLGQPPRYGRYTYFEKFDYFAVFWGVPVIGLSGLVLWLPAFFARFLPGTLFNLAAVVHSEEALLAAGFIFTFHFFHNHLRPENFPMDTSIFTGRVSLARMKLERPEEYEEYERSGTLDGLCLPAPEQNTLWKGRLFGLIALTLGLFLVAAIFSTYVCRNW